uniref:Uncharacterized protein n=1 Tax=Romanomermis culicivorax TaxID=13658 RepID=A0A915J266_ROMCU
MAHGWPKVSESTRLICAGNIIQSFSSRAKFKNHIEYVQSKFKTHATNEESGFFNNFCYCPLLV